MAKNRNLSKSDVKKLNKVYKRARDCVHHCDMARLDPMNFCSTSEPGYIDVCEAIENKDRSKLAEIFLTLNQQKRELLFNGEITEAEYMKWCDGIRMTN